MKKLAILSVILLGACEVTDGANGAQLSYGTSVYSQFNCQKEGFSTVIYTDDHCVAGQSCQWEWELAHKATSCAGDYTREFDLDDAIDKIEACGFTVETELDYQPYLDPMGDNLNRDFDSDFLIITNVPLYSHDKDRILNYASDEGFVLRVQEDVKLSDCKM